MKDWNLDIFALDRASDHRPLFVLGWTIFKGIRSMLSECGIELGALANFLRHIEGGYKPEIPYV